MNINKYMEVPTSIEWILGREGREGRWGKEEMERRMEGKERGEDRRWEEIGKGKIGDGRKDGREKRGRGGKRV